MPLSREGIALVVEGVQKYISDLGAADKAQRQFREAVELSARAISGQTAVPNTQFNVGSEAARIAARSGREYQDVVRAINAELRALERPAQAVAGALGTQAVAMQAARSSGISYLSTLSAIHAASFLVSNSTFTAAGSLVTMGLAFSKLGPGAIAVGAGFGTALFAIGSLLNAFDTFRNVAVSTLETATKAAVGFGAAIGAASAASVKLAADVETRFALIGAVASDAAEPGKLGKLEGTISNISRQFGIGAGEATEAASLYVRAGGNIQKAIDGALEAIVNLTTASAGELGAAQAARSIAQLETAFKDQGIAAKDAADFMVGLAQTTTLSFQEIVQALQQIGPTASNLNIPLLDVGAALAVLSQNGLRGAVAGSSLKQALIELSDPSARASKEMIRYGISLFDVNGKIRDLDDVIGDLATAFGQAQGATGPLSDAQRSLAINTIFTSRAQQAANILAKQGADAFIEYRNGIAAVTATDVAQQLLVPTAKQADIARRNIEELARAFGGPLNAGIGLGLNAVNRFLQSIGRGPFEIAGQAVVALATGEGFGTLKKAIEELADTDVANFATGLLATLASIRDSIVSTIVPAFEGLGEKISAALQGIDVSKTFNDIARAASAIAGVVAAVINVLGDLAVEFIENRDRGKELRDFIAGLAIAMGTSLVGAAVLAAVPLITMAKILEALGKATLQTLDHILTFGTDSINVFDLLGTAITRFFNHLGGQFTAFAGIARGMTEVLSGVRLGPAGIVQIKNGIDQITASVEQLNKARSEPSQDIGGGILQTIRQLRDGIQQAREAATDIDFDTIFKESAEGVQTSLAAIIASVQRAQQAGERAGDAGERSEPGFLPNEDKMRQLANKAEEIVEDLTRRINSLNEDNLNDLNRLVRDTLQKMGDDESKLADALEDLRTKAAEQIDDIFEETRIQRAIQDSLEDFRRLQEDEADIRGEGLQRQEIEHQHSLDRIKSQRSRDTEDTTRAFGIQQDIARQAYNNQVSLADIAFKRVQQLQEVALSRRQSEEERLLDVQLQAEATRRNETRDLSRATTSEERRQIQQRINDTRSDTQFAAQQDARRLALRRKQEEEQRAFQNQQEDAQFARRISQQLAEFEFRLKLEQAAIQLRRDLEDAETEERKREAFDEFRRRVGLARNETVFRRGQQDQLTQAQRFFDDFNNNRRRDQIERERVRREQVLGREFAQRGATTLREFSDNVARLDTSKATQINTILGAIADKETDLIRASKELGVPLPPQFNQLQILKHTILDIAQAYQLATDAQTDFIGGRLNPENIQNQLQQQIPELNTDTTRRPAQVPVLRRQITPVSTQVMQFAQTALTETQLGRAVFTGIKLARDFGIFPQVVDVDINTTPGNTPSLIDLLRTGR